MTIREEILLNSGIVTEGFVNKAITKKMYAKTDEAERNLRRAEKNHPEYTLKNAIQKSEKTSDVKMTNEQKAFALKCRDLVELREMIKKYQNSKDIREKLDLYTDITSLLQAMPKKHKNTQLKDSIYTAAGFGAFMYAFAIPAILLFKSSDGGNIPAILSAAAALSSYSTMKVKRGINYVNNMNDNIAGVKKGKENIKSLGKRDRFSSDLEKYRNVDIDVDSEKEEAKIQKRKEFIDRIISKIITAINNQKSKIKNSRLFGAEFSANVKEERTRIGKLVEEGYFDGFNSFDDFYITEDGTIEEGIVGKAFKTIVLTSAILMGLTKFGISTQEIKSTIVNAGGQIVKTADSNVDAMRGNSDNLSKSLVIAWGSGKTIMHNLSLRLKPMMDKTIKTGKPIVDSASLDIVSNVCFVASGITEGLSKNENVPESIRREFSSITANLKKIGAESGASGDENKVSVVSSIANKAYSEIKKAEKLVQ